MDRNVAIFDLDGTLANIEHRTHFVRGPRKQRNWKKFFEACVDDVPKWDVIDTLHGLRLANWHVEIWSGRSDAVREQTVNWLLDKAMIPTQDVNSLGVPLRMRPDGDFTRDSDLKSGFLSDFWQTHLRPPTIIFDDRDQVVEMWRARGITCAQIAPGDF